MLAVPVDWFLGEEVITINPASILMTGEPWIWAGTGATRHLCRTPLAASIQVDQVEVGNQGS